jgi:sugar phosphate isomerase/epimerase
MKSISTERPLSFNRRDFVKATSAVVVGATTAVGAASLLVAKTPPAIAPKIPLGFDNFSIRAHQWKADRLIKFAGEHQLDSLLMSDLNVYENFDAKYLGDLKLKASDAGVLLHAGTGSICPTAQRFTDKWGTAEELLRLGIRVANSLGSPVFRCYLGGEKDRHSEGGIQSHIDATVAELKKVRTFAIDSNVKIAVENHAGDMQAWELVNLIDAAGPEFVGATIDSGNATWTLEHPTQNLEVLGPYAVSSGIRDSTVWDYEQGAMVAWNAVGEGQVDWANYAERYSQLCPDVPFQLEIISGFSKSFAHKTQKFWKVYPEAKASDFSRFLELARSGKSVANGQANDPEFQMNELMKSIRYCKSKLGMGRK